MLDAYIGTRSDTETQPPLGAIVDRALTALAQFDAVPDAEFRKSPLLYVLVASLFVEIPQSDHLADTLRLIDKAYVGVLLNPDRRADLAARLGMVGPACVWTVPHNFLRQLQRQAHFEQLRVWATDFTTSTTAALRNTAAALLTELVADPEPNWEGTVLEWPRFPLTRKARTRMLGLVPLSNIIGSPQQLPPGTYVPVVRYYKTTARRSGIWVSEHKGNNPQAYYFYEPSSDVYLRITSGPGGPRILVAGNKEDAMARLGIQPSPAPEVADVAGVSQPLALLFAQSDDPSESRNWAAFSDAHQGKPGWEDMATEIKSAWANRAGRLARAYTLMFIDGTRPPKRGQPPEPVMPDTDRQDAVRRAMKDLLEHGPIPDPASVPRIEVAPTGQRAAAVTPFLNDEARKWLRGLSDRSDPFIAAGARMQGYEAVLLQREAGTEAWHTEIVDVREDSYGNLYRVIGHEFKKLRSLKDVPKHPTIWFSSYGLVSGGEP